MMPDGAEPSQRDASSHKSASNDVSDSAQRSSGEEQLCARAAGHRDQSGVARHACARGHRAVDGIGAW